MDSLGVTRGTALGDWAALEMRSHHLPLTAATSMRPGDDMVAVLHQHPCLVMTSGPSSVLGGGVSDGGPLLHGQRRGGD